MTDTQTMKAEYETWYAQFWQDVGPPTNWEIWQAAWTRKPAAQVAGAEQLPVAARFREAKYGLYCKPENLRWYDEDWRLLSLEGGIVIAKDIEEENVFWQEVEFLFTHPTPEPDATKVVSVPTWQEQAGDLYCGAHTEIEELMIAEITALRAALAADRERT